MHHADRPEADLRVAADRALVGRGRVDGEPVMLPPLAQETGEQADGLGANAAALVGGGGPPERIVTCGPRSTG
jgi:hypothetical protein